MKENGKRTELMEKVNSSMLTAMFSKVLGKKIRPKVMASTSMLTETFTKGIGIAIINMDTELSYG
jgi:hypothetical protein